MLQGPTPATGDSLARLISVVGEMQSGLAISSSRTEAHMGDVLLEEELAVLEEDSDEDDELEMLFAHPWGVDAVKSSS